MADTKGPSRRHLLTGQLRSHHISSAVVTVLPEQQEHVRRRIESMADVEIYHEARSKMVLVLEGPDSGVIGSKLLEIAGIEGVLAANFVFEHVERISDPGERG